MRLLTQFISVSVLLMLFGCGGRQKTFSVTDEKERWTAKGWSYLETFGKPAEDTVMVSQMSSATAREVTAFARTDGIVTHRVFAQTQNFYLVVSMQRPGGDAFALVFTKPKP